MAAEGSGKVVEVKDDYMHLMDVIFVCGVWKNWPYLPWYVFLTCLFFSSGESRRRVCTWWAWVASSQASKDTIFTSEGETLSLRSRGRKTLSFGGFTRQNTTQVQPCCQSHIYHILCISLSGVVLTSATWSVCSTQPAPGRRSRVPMGRLSFSNRFWETTCLLLVTFPWLACC